MKGKTKFLLMDVDGTLTDGKIYMGNSGEVFKTFSIKDGCGIHDILPQHGIIPIVITARESKIVKNRCDELGIQDYYQNVRDKAEKMHEIAYKYGLNKNEQGEYCGVAYIGDDIIDLPCMSLCEIKGCPADAVQEVKSICDFISHQNGGNGAVREFIEWLVGNQ